MVTTTAGNNTKRRYLGSVSLILQIGIGIFSIYWVIRWGNISFDQILQRSTRVSYLPLILGVGLFILTTILSALRYSLLLQNKISFRYLTGLYLFQNVMLTITPWRIGEISFPVLLKKDYGINLIKSGSVLILIRIVDFVLLVSIVIISGYRIAIPFAWIWIPIIAIIFVIMIVLLANNKLLQVSIFERIKIEWNTLEPYRNARNIIVLFALSVAIVVSITMQTWFILRSVSFRIDLFDVLLFNAITLLASVLPIHPSGGWGTIDSIQSIVLTTMGYETQAAVTAILIAHTIYTMMILGGGVLGWLIRRSTLRK